MKAVATLALCYLVIGSFGTAVADCTLDTPNGQFGITCSGGSYDAIATVDQGGLYIVRFYKKPTTGGAWTEFANGSKTLSAAGTHAITLPNIGSLPPNSEYLGKATLERYGGMGSTSLDSNEDGHFYGP